jgi:peptidoglycan hydrolase FlgJ
MTKLSPTPQMQLPKQVPPVPAVADPGMAATAATRPLRPSQAVDPAKIAKSAHDFEAMAIGQLLQPMFDTVNTSKGKFGGGPGEEAWKPMLVQEFAKQISAHGGLGLAKPVYDAMLRMQEANPK